MSYRYLILGLLAERPMSGYDIKKQVKRTLGLITSASYGTLYPTLHKLLAEGCVEMQEIPQRSRPSKKVYNITDAGREDVKAWLRQPAAADQLRREFLLKLFLAMNMAQDVSALIAQRRSETEKLLATLHADRENAGSKQQAWLMDYTLAQVKAEVDWLDGLVIE